MKNAIVSITSSDLDTVTGGGTLLSPGNTKAVLQTLGHDERSVMAVANEYRLTPGGIFANGAYKGAQNSFGVLNAVKPWQ